MGHRELVRQLGVSLKLCPAILRAGEGKGRL